MTSKTALEMSYGLMARDLRRKSLGTRCLVVDLLCWSAPQSRKQRSMPARVTCTAPSPPVLPVPVSDALLVLDEEVHVDAAVIPTGELPGDVVSCSVR